MQYRESQAFLWLLPLWRRASYRVIEDLNGRPLAVRRLCTPTEKRRHQKRELARIIAAARPVLQCPRCGWVSRRRDDARCPDCGTALVS